MFIILTMISGNKIRINTNLIESYCEITKESYYCDDSYLGKTALIPVGMRECDKPYIVDETVEEVDNIIIFTKEMGI